MMMTGDLLVVVATPQVLRGIHLRRKCRVPPGCSINMASREVKR